ncbi:MAG: D-alanyl-D-alanine carboxypeptidase family protein [Zetaproteobacteria bacterium]|nr:MAG: D-alanyl-D-alanine carboxypeptidase family protein [Zetaproteobacteria bacterium]
MIRRMMVAVFAGLLFMAAGEAHAIPWPQSPNIKAKSWTLLDANSGQVLGKHNENEKLAPASLTKMMTLYLAFEDLKLGRLKLDESISVSRKAWKIGGSTMFLDPRMHPNVEELLHGIATLSGNDACIALAEHIAGSEDAFAERMNQKASELGMTHTHFVNATGFPAKNHYSSAMDMALLGAALWRDFPDQYKIFREKSYTYKGHTQPNRNRLLWSYPLADGIKTGHTKDAGYCLVGSAEKDRSRLVAAIFGANSDAERASQTKVLLTFGFRNFSTLRPAERDIRRQVEVYQGKANHVWLIPANPIWITVPRGYEKRVSFRLRYPAPLIAPVKQGENIGVIEAVMTNKKKEPQVLAQVNMQARRAVKQASWIGRQWDSLRLWWSKKDVEDAP